MRIFITFGDKRYAKTRNFAARMAKWLGGFDKVIAYTPDDIDDDFKNQHSDIFNIKRGYGLWLWKPYLIYKTLTQVAKDGDAVFWGDGGSFFIRNVKHIEKVMGDDDMWLSCVPLQEWQFTKADCLRLMDCENERLAKTAQRQGSFLYIFKTNNSVAFIKEWLDRCCDINLLHPENIGLGLPNPPGFFAHREDQSILSLLSKQRGIKAHQDPSQFGKYPELYLEDHFMRAEIKPFGSDYPVLIILHRTPNVSMLRVAKQLFLAIIPRYIGLKCISYNKRLNDYNYGKIGKINTRNGG